jgi:hypothetical protein
MKAVGFSASASCRFHGIWAMRDPAVSHVTLFQVIGVTRARANGGYGETRHKRHGPPFFPSFVGQPLTAPAPKSAMVAYLA